MGIIVGLCVTSSFQIMATSLPRRNTFIMDIIIELYVVSLLNCCNKRAQSRTTNNYINAFKVSLFHHQTSIDLEKCKIQSPTQQKEKAGSCGHSMDGIRYYSS
jgi:hypothetical protein